MSLTPKQEKFCQRYVELSNASEAYRQSYNAENMKIETVWECASRLLSDSKVSARVVELQEEHKQRHMVTVDSLTKELEEARDLALETQQASSAVSATMGKAKLHGLLVEKQRVEIEATLKDMSEKEIERRIAELSAKE